MIVLPKFGPQVTRVESYPLGDYLYSRSKSREDLALLQLRWRRYKESLSADDRETIEKVEKLFRGKVNRGLDRAKLGA